MNRGDARRHARHGIDKLLGGVGYELVAKHYYSPIPDLASLPDDVWTRRSAMSGIRIDVDASLRFVERELASFLSEYRPPRARTADSRTFYLDNDLYGSGDAELLYAMIRRFAPRRVLELGSGMSTLVIADARARNEPAADGWHIVCDPYPRDDLPLRDVADVRTLDVQRLPADLIDELRSGDVLFVDTTHAVKVGGDVNRLILDFLPALAPGVLVHIHDIFLPWEYPREFMAERRFFWTEQYLLQAFLAFNDAYAVLCPAHALVRAHTEAFAELVPGRRPYDPLPSAFWMRRALSSVPPCP